MLLVNENCEAYENIFNDVADYDDINGLLLKFSC